MIEGQQLAAIVLAAGQGKRMRSKSPKVLHRICGRPIVSYVLSAVAELNPDRLLVVVGHGAEEVAAAVDNPVELVSQEKQMGTGHAVKLALKKLTGSEWDVVVVCGDTPLVRSSTLAELVQTRRRIDSDAVLVATFPESPRGYGRVLRDYENGIVGIIEERDATEDQRGIREVNAGIYCFKSAALSRALAEVESDNDQGEFYLTDCIGIIRKNGGSVSSLTADAEEMMGVNSRSDLAGVEAVMLKRLRKELMDKGATFIMPETTYVEHGVAISADTVIEPNCYLAGETSVGSGCRVGPSTVLRNVKIGNDVSISFTVAADVVIEDGVQVGPFCSLRPGTVLRQGAKAGTFVELKKTEIGERGKVPHLSYMGDATLGKDVNIGAGTITCNYDGINKYETVVGDNAFVGSDTMLVAPVKIGEGAVTAAGSAITKDVPAKGLGIERSPQKNIEGWAERHFRDKDKKKDK